MNTTDLLNIRLYNQLLMGSNMKTPREIVSWMGAMQSQNYEMAKWGIGIRLPGITNRLVEEAINKGDIIRTHILRPTWHFVTNEDVHWMLELCATRLKSAFFNYAKMMGVDEALIAKAISALPQVLEEHGHSTRQEIGEHLNNRKITIDQDMVKYVMSRAELDSIVCSGVVRGSKQTYALLHKQAPKTLHLSKEEALERLARQYFTSHGPATLADYVWWSGLSVTEAKKGIELIKQDFICEEINGKSYWMKNDIHIPPRDTQTAFLLPAFDEFVVSYKDRSEIIEEEHYRKVMTRTGIFSPTITLNGEIIGAWKRVVKKKSVQAELEFFGKVGKKVEKLFEGQVKGYEEFNGGDK